MQYRQGDVLIERVDSIPAEAKVTTNKVIAHGEVTGHAHRIAEVNFDDVDILVDENGNMFLQAKAEAAIVHDEHGTIDLPAGDYKIVRQRQYDKNAKEEERRVLD